MILRTITDELASFLILALILLAAWFELGYSHPLVFSVAASIFIVIYFLMFLLLKILAPNLYINQPEPG